MILSELYKSLLTRITGLADVKFLAYNQGQLETEEDFDHMMFPAVLIEFLPFTPQAMGQKRQGADIQIIVTVASEVVQRTDARETDTIRNLGLAHMVLLDNIHAQLQGWNGLGLTPTVNFNALNRTGFAPYDGIAGLDNSMLMVHTMTYTTRIIDDAALVMYELMNPQPGLEINGVFYAPLPPAPDPDPPTPPETHVHSIVPGEGISVNATDPENPVVTNTGVLEVVAGDGVEVDDTDPQRPVVSADIRPNVSFIFGVINNVIGNNIRYHGIDGNGINQSTEGVNYLVAPNSCIISRLHVRIRTKQPAEGDLIWRLFINGAATSLSVTIPANSAPNLVFSDLVNSVLITAGDLICWQTTGPNVASAAVSAVSALITLI